MCLYQGSKVVVFPVVKWRADEDKVGILLFLVSIIILKVSPRVKSFKASVHCHVLIFLNRSFTNFCDCFFFFFKMG